jgi:hypothetical protein
MLRKRKLHFKGKEPERQSTYILDGDYLGVDQHGIPLSKEKEIAARVMNT